MRRVDPPGLDAIPGDGAARLLTETTSDLLGVRVAIDAEAPEL